MYIFNQSPTPEGWPWPRKSQGKQFFCLPASYSPVAVTSRALQGLPPDWVQHNLESPHVDQLLSVLVSTTHTTRVVTRPFLLGRWVCVFPFSAGWPSCSLSQKGFLHKSEQLVKSEQSFGPACLSDANKRQGIEMEVKPLEGNVLCNFCNCKAEFNITLNERLFFQLF